MPGPMASNDDPHISVAIGRWAVGAAPAKLRTLLGSCVAVILYDRIARTGGIAHILLPDSQGGAADHPGRYADTALPALLRDMAGLAPARARRQPAAKLAGGATMFATGQAEGIGERNVRAVEGILEGLGIPVTARDVGGTTGRRVTLETATGRVVVKIPGGAEYEI